MNDLSVNIISNSNQNDQNVNNDIFEEIDGKILINEIDNTYVNYTKKIKLKYYENVKKDSKRKQNEYSFDKLVDSKNNEKVVNHSINYEKSLNNSTDINLGNLQHSFNDKLNIILKENNEDNNKVTKNENDKKVQNDSLNTNNVTYLRSFNKIVIYTFNNLVGIISILKINEFSIMFTKYFEKINEKQFKNNLDISYISELANMPNLEILIFSEMGISIKDIIKEKLGLKNIFISQLYEISENDFSKLTFTFNLLQEDKNEFININSKKINLVMYISDTEDFEAFIDEKVPALLQL